MRKGTEKNFKSQKNGVATLNLAVKFRLLLIPHPIFLYIIPVFWVFKK